MIAFSGLTEFYEARGGRALSGVRLRLPKLGRPYSRRLHRLHHPALPLLRYVAAPAGGPRPAHRGLIRGQRRYVMLDTVPDELPKPQVHGYFVDWTESPRPGWSISWFTGVSQMMPSKGR